MGATESGFKDHFSGHAGAYSRHRPTYPAALFAYLASLPPSRQRAWDCATGNGQAATGLARHFDSVIATDASAEQIRHASPHERVEYRVAPAEDPGLEPGSIDLVTAAQAAHWFDPERFRREVERVLAPGGFVAVWCYGVFRISPAVDPVIDRLYSQIVGPWWPPERRLVDEGYRSLPFDFEERPAPAFAIEVEWTLEEVTGYIGTWSAVRRYAAGSGVDPITLVQTDLTRAWGDPDERLPIRWPIGLRVGRPRPAGD
jgi:SAM-dependent methyltransferase